MFSISDRLWAFDLFILFYFILFRILAGDHWEPVFLVSGDDNQVHLYREINFSSEVRDDPLPRLLNDGW